MSEIYTKLVGINEHQRLPEHTLFRNTLDLTFVYYFEMTDENTNPRTVYLDSRFIRERDISLRAMHDFALANCERDKKAVFAPMEEIIENVSGPESSNVYVLTNEEMRFGATAMFYPGRLSMIAEKLDSDLIILPSSVHECLVLRKKDYGEASEFTEIVRSVNDTVLADEDILSYSVYTFDRVGQKLAVGRSYHH